MSAIDWMQQIKRRCRTDDRGSITGFVVVMTVAIVMCAGLVFDGGRVVSARIEAADVAENAARAGIQQTTGLRGDHLKLDPIAAHSEAMNYLASHGLSGSVSVSDTSVSVTVTTTTSMTMLAAIGVPPKTITVTRTAMAVTQ
jgi:hypothetical protein